MYFIRESGEEKSIKQFWVSNQTKEIINNHQADDNMHLDNIQGVQDQNFRIQTAITQKLYT